MTDIVHLAGLKGTIGVWLQATGDCHRAIALRLLAARFNVPLISSVALADTRKAIAAEFERMAEVVQGTRCDLIDQDGGCCIA